MGKLDFGLIALRFYAGTFSVATGIAVSSTGCFDIFGTVVNYDSGCDLVYEIVGIFMRLLFLFSRLRHLSRRLWRRRCPI